MAVPLAAKASQLIHSPTTRSAVGADRGERDLGAADCHRLGAARRGADQLRTVGHAHPAACAGRGTATGAGRMIPSSYPARQRNRRLARGLQETVIALALLLVAGALAGMGNSTLAVMLLVLSLFSASRCWHSLGLAQRNAVGARSEQRVRAELKALEREGWRIRHSLRWRGGGDIDHEALAPHATGLAFAIETKTRTYRPGDLARIAAVAQWLARRRAGRCREAVPVLCLASGPAIEQWERGVLVVSADRLTGVLRRLAGTTQKPGFLR